MHDGERFTLFGRSEGVPEGQLSGMLEDAQGHLWVGSDSGLSTFLNGRFVTLTTKNGLPGDRIFFAITDESGAIWLGVGAGLARVTADDLQHAVTDPNYRIRYRLYDSSDGLQGTPVHRGTPTASRAPDGTIWFVTTSGIAIVDPKQLQATLVPPTPHLERVIVNGRATAVTEDLAVPPRTSSLQIEYSALNLTSPSKVRFRHRLEGIDANWVEDGGNAQTIYANLSPGRYRFHLAASNGDDAWKALPVWSFSVQPTWYQTRALYVAAAVLVALLGWTAWQVRVRQMRHEFSMVLAERARVGREIHDTLLQSLVGMALQLDNVSGEIDASAPALKDEMLRMRRQVEHYIEEAQQSIWDLRSPHDHGGDLPTMLRERGERLTESTGVRFTFVVAGTARKISGRVEQQVLRIAEEAVINAVRHGHPTDVRVELVYEAAAVHLHVSDNGRGFDPQISGSQAEGHWGMSIMRERAGQIGASFAISSAPAQGTRIDIVAPAES